jgi:hypothetical protein
LRPRSIANFYSLIVAELEVQVAPLFGGAPVAAVEVSALEEVERARDRAARSQLAGEDEQDTVLYRPKGLFEERPCKVRTTPLLVVRSEVKPVHQGGMFAAEILPREPLDLEPFAFQLAALA